MSGIQIKNLESIRETARQFIHQMGERNIFAFHGKMGAGKTTFIKAVCEELGVSDVINSPTFAIVNEYQSAQTGKPIYHFDFYRIRSIEEAYDIGVADYFNSDAFCFIEWPEKIEPLLPENTVFLNIVEKEDGSREVFNF